MPKIFSLRSCILGTSCEAVYTYHLLYVRHEVVRIHPDAPQGVESSTERTGRCETIKATYHSNKPSCPRGTQSTGSGIEGYSTMTKLTLVRDALLTLPPHELLAQIA